ncbi:MAG: SusD/RagB family nutrient-binding outer membrane lipoprotein [Bacteroides sp.]|nr:SusD/RagB family nutrient-binding outer membrane lipoprotein [Bacteroides sp.]
MKRNKFIIRLFTLGLLIASLSACTDKYEGYNRNPYDVDDEEKERDAYNVRTSLTYMQGWVIPLDVNACQFSDCLLGGPYGGYLADSNSGFNNKNFSTYIPEETWAKVMFNDFIPKLYPTLATLKQATDDPIPLAVAEIIKVISMLRVTDTYGPIPYSQIGADGKLTAPYDSQEDVYMKMFEELDASIAILTENQTINFNPKADLVYDGNTVKWIKLANSIKLRMAVRIANVSPSIAQQKAEEVAQHSIGAFTSNDDNASVSIAVTNPFRVVMYEYNGGDSRISADITSYMNGYEDPRREKYFELSSFTASDLIGKKVNENGYYGLRSGIEIPSGNLVRRYANMAVSANTRLLWMNAAEVAFLKAEGAMRGWNMGTPDGVSFTTSAEGFYKKGIQLSFEQWGAGGAEQYMENETLRPQVYEDPMEMFSYDATTSNITIKWKNASGYDEENLERIITQKWIANFPLGHEAWAEYRRTGYPKLMEVMVNNSGGRVNSVRMARRLHYPQTEYTENGENLSEAISKYLGGADTMGTDIWWAKKN